MLTMDSIVSRGALQMPHRPAIFDNGSTYSWLDLETRVSAVARHLADLGVGRHGRLAVASRNSFENYCLYYATARLGATFTPLNYQLSDAELSRVLSDLDPQWILTIPEFRNRFSDLEDSAQCGVVEFGDRAWDSELAHTQPFRETRSRPSDVHTILYTSGTTGLPKGVMHTQEAEYMDALCGALGYQLGPNDRYIVHAPSFHAASWDHAKLFLLSGGAIAILPEFNPTKIIAAIPRHKITVLFAVTAMLQRLLDDPTFTPSALNSLTAVHYGGALGSDAVLKRFIDALGHPVELRHVYGCSEAGPHVCFNSATQNPDKPRSIGKPIPGVTMRIADPEESRDLGCDEVGEILVGGPAIMKGYWGKPAETERAIVEGWLRTGDLGYVDQDGDFFMVDRIGDKIRTGGENVFASEVEYVLSRHPAVAESFVLGVPDPHWDEAVIALVIPRAGASIDSEELREFCRSHLAGFKIPKRVYAVDEFPRTGLGKVARGTLRQRAISEDSRRQRAER